jgi:hypothetical protein
MRKGFLIYEEMCKYLVIFEEDVSPICLCSCSRLEFLIYDENFVFFLISVGSCTGKMASKVACIFIGRMRIHSGEGHG